MTVELRMLTLTGLLSLVLAVLTIAIHLRRYGGRMIRGNRDDFPPLDGLAARVARAHANLNEALLPFAILALAAHAAHISNIWTIYACAGFFTARALHAALYLIGATPWRSVAFYLGLLSTLVLAGQLPFV
jgi:uncharacterized MAPEG superfamily protein